MRNQFALDHFFGQQTHRPATSTFQRRRTNDGDNLLALVLVQRRCFAWTRGIEQRWIKAVLTIPLADLPNGLGRKTQVGPDNRCRLPLIQLPQRQSTHHNAYRLQAAT